MSDVPPAEGWWKASDGRWYPPETPTQQAAPVQTMAPPTYSAPPAYGAPTPPVTTGRGGKKILLVVGAIAAAIAIIGGLVAVLGGGSGSKNTASSSSVPAAPLVADESCGITVPELESITNETWQGSQPVTGECQFVVSTRPTFVVLTLTNGGLPSDFFGNCEPGTTSRPRANSSAASCLFTGGSGTRFAKMGMTRHGAGIIFEQATAASNEDPHAFQDLFTKIIQNFAD